MLPLEISELRNRLRWSMSRLARELGVAADLIVDWENGERFPTKKHVAHLVRLLETAGESLHGRAGSR